MATPRERILKAMNHQEPDMIPLDLSGHRSSGISAMVYPKLRQCLGLQPKPVRVYDPIQQLAIVDEDVLNLFGVDTIELGRAFATEDSDWKEWILPDNTPCYMPSWALPEKVDNRWVFKSLSGRVIAHMPPGVWFFEQTHYPFYEQDDLDNINAAFGESMWTALRSPPGPLAAGESGIKVLQDGARQLRSKTDRAILGLFGGNLLEVGQFLYRNDQFLMMLAGDPEKAHKFLDKLVELHTSNLEKFLGAVGPYIDIIVFGDDLGMQKGPQISPKTYREFFKPRHKHLWNLAKKLAPVKVMLHCCGGVRELLPDLIDAGLDAINPVQITCRGMESEGLKRDFGADMVFWGGGCNTQEVLAKATPQQVREHVKRQLDIWRPGGGFVFQQVHNIMADVPPQNVIAMLETVRGR